MIKPDVVKHIVMRAYVVTTRPLTEDWDSQGNVLVWDSWNKVWKTKNWESSWNNDHFFMHDRYTHWMVIRDSPCYEID